MKLEAVKKQYKNEWILAEVLEEDKLNRPTKVKVIAHSKDRGETYEAMEKIKIKDFLHFYTGKVPKKGYAVAF